MLRSTGDRSRQPFRSNFSRVGWSLMFVVSSNGSPARFDALIKRRNSSDLLQRYFRPRQVISFKPLVDQFAMDVNTAERAKRDLVCHTSSKIGWRVGSHLNL